jgi:predicted transcriptional regulator
MIITPEQIRAARALLRMEQDELARRAQVSVARIQDIIDEISLRSAAHQKGLEQWTEDDLYDENGLPA